MADKVKETKKPEIKCVRLMQEPAYPLTSDSRTLEHGHLYKHFEMTAEGVYILLQRGNAPSNVFIPMSNIAHVEFENVVVPLKKELA